MLSLLVGLCAVPANAAEPFSIIVSSEKADVGNEVTVTISVTGNTGLASLKFDVAYDSALTLTKVEFSEDFGPMVTAPEPFRNPEPLTMISPLSDITANGVFATLTFTVSEDVINGYKANVTVTYDENDIYDGEYNNVPVTVVNGSVEVGEGVRGDTNGDGRLNISDVFAIKEFILIGEGEVANYDITGDGKVNISDLFEIKRMLM